MKETALRFCSGLTVFAINAGYDITIIWESDFNANKHNILNTLL